MTPVPPTRHPAAPEGDVRLTEAEREALAHAFVRYSFAPKDWVEVIAPAVERIVAERVRVVEGERDAAHGRHAEREQRWHWNLIREQNAIFKANAATARAESAEAALAELRAGVEALADEYPAYGNRLRALLGGAS